MSQTETESCCCNDVVRPGIGCSCRGVQALLWQWHRYTKGTTAPTDGPCCSVVVGQVRAVPAGACRHWYVYLIAGGQPIPCRQPRPCTTVKALHGILCEAILHAAGVGMVCGGVAGQGCVSAAGQHRHCCCHRPRCTEAALMPSKLHTGAFVKAQGAQGIHPQNG